MTKKRWIGAANTVPHIVDVTFSNIGFGDICTLTLNGKSVSGQSTDGLLTTLVSNLVAAWQSADFGEMQVVQIETLNQVEQDDTSAVIGVRLSTTQGTFTVTATMSNIGAAGVSIKRTQRGGAAALQEVVYIVVPPSTGGNFRLNFGGGGFNTADIPYNSAP